ncbi:MAG: prepilin peptidase [Candidatus Sumerlaeaceae bacterium]|nr:prepilin peptidase [Candidatus Sumerlaeaceae bacterium]
MVTYAAVFFLVVSFVLGAVWGSFLNVCIYRIPLGKSVIFPGSHCTACGTPIKWYDNIPIISYLILQGHCRACGAYFSARYAGIELLTAILFLLLWLRYPAQPLVVAQWIIACLLIVATFTDVDHFIIPDSISLGGCSFALVASGLLGSSSLCAMDFEFWKGFLDFGFKATISSSLIGQHLAIFLWSALGAAFGWGLLSAVALFGRYVFAKEAMGGGDVKLFAFIGGYFGMTGVLAVLFLSAVVGAIVGVSILLWHKFFCRDEIDEVEFRRDRAKFPPYAEIHPERVSVIPELDLSSSTEVDKNRVIRVARRTSRQLHHFPYGPYIAFAAMLMLFFYPELHEWLREHLWLISEPSWQ